jgi:hypothetical protein
MVGRFFRWCFSTPREPRSAMDVVAWWEVRRIPYNLIVLIAGMVSLPLFLVFIELAHGLKAGEDAVEPMALVVAVVVGPCAVNLAYTAGWIVELFLRLAWRGRAAAIGPTLMRLGLSFSLLVVFFPAIFWGGAWVVRSLP